MYGVAGLVCLVVGWVCRAVSVIRWRNKTQHHIRKRKLQWTATLIMGGTWLALCVIYKSNCQALASS